MLLATGDALRRQGQANSRKRFIDCLDLPPATAGLISLGVIDEAPSVAHPDDLDRIVLEVNALERGDEGRRGAHPALPARTLVIARLSTLLLD